jgi:hypothetical protein
MKRTINRSYEVYKPLRKHVKEDTLTVITTKASQNTEGSPTLILIGNNYPKLLARLF